MPVYKIRRIGGSSSTRRLLDKENIRLLVEAKNREEVAKILGGHLYDRDNNLLFFKKSELEKNPAWKEVDRNSIDVSKDIATAGTVFALEVKPGIDLKVIFWEDEKSHINCHGPTAYVPYGYHSDGNVRVLLNYHFSLENMGDLYRKKS